MKLLFCHDGPMAMDKDKNAYPQTFTEDVLSRYYDIADEMIILTRTKLIEPNEIKLKKANMERLRIVSSPNLASIKNAYNERKKAEKIVIREMKNCDYLIARLPSFIGNIAVDVARKLNKPFLVEIVACPWDAFWNHSFKGKLIAPFMYYATKNRVRNANCSVYVTNHFLKNRYPTNGRSTNCSNVALRKFDDKVIEKRLTKIINMKEEDKIVLGTTAAVDVRYKGQQYIIKALGELKKEGITKFEYQLVGGGNQAYLKSIAKKYDVTKQVKFLGAIPHNKVFEWLEDIDIYVQPSRQEGLPRALIEAMSRGIPAFGANTAGIPELLEVGFIFGNNRKNVGEICTIIKSFDKYSMTLSAKKNFNESKKYDKRIIDDRRSKFFREFAESADNY